VAAFVVPGNGNNISSNPSMMGLFAPTLKPEADMGPKTPQS
jgi:hypothetical protein